MGGGGQRARVSQEGWFIGQGQSETYEQMWPGGVGSDRSDDQLVEGDGWDGRVLVDGLWSVALVGEHRREPAERADAEHQLERRKRPDLQTEAASSQSLASRPSVLACLRLTSNRPDANVRQSHCVPLPASIMFSTELVTPSSTVIDRSSASSALLGASSEGPYRSDSSSIPSMSASATSTLA